MFRTLLCAILLSLSLSAFAQDSLDSTVIQASSTDSVQMEYFIQIASLKSAFEKFPALKDLGFLLKIRHETQDLYRYQLGIYESRETAEKILLVVRNRGFKDAFIVGRPLFSGG